MADNKDGFTPEELRLNEILKKASSEIAKIDATIQKILDDPTPAPHPSPFQKIPTIGRKEALVAEQEQKKAELEDQTRKNIDKDVEDSQKNPTLVMVQKITEWNQNTAVYPKSVNEEKDISESQEYLLKVKDSDQPRKSYEELLKEESNKPFEKSSMSQKFVTSLGYTQLSDKQKTEIEKIDKAQSFNQNRDDITKE